MQEKTVVSFSKIYINECIQGESMKRTPIPIDEAIKEKIREIGRLWKNSNSQPKINSEFLSKWEKLIYEWKDDKSLPLIIRNKQGSRGSEIKHKATGRSIIFSDNSFAKWVYENVMDEKSFTLDDIKQNLKDDKIPIALVIKPSEKKNAKYKKTLGKNSVNKRGWKLCHIAPIGFKNSTLAENRDINELEDHFVKFGNPKNMFLLPLEIGFLGEIQEFIDEQK
jgi:hypothetical protein